MNLLRISQYLQRFIHVHVYALIGMEQKRKIKVLTELYQWSVDFLNTVGEPYWLDFGSLLGYYRERGFLLHDIDVDFGMHEKSYEVVISKKHLLPPEMKFYDSSYRHHGPKLYFNYKGFDVDIYFYEDLGEEIRNYENTRWPNERREVGKYMIYPPKVVSFLNRQIFIPNKSEEYLKYIYGFLGKNGKRNLKTGFWEKK